MSKLIIVRGLPGSGKSTVAKGFPYFHVEADMFFMKDGSYQFDPTKISNAHRWCSDMVIGAMNKGMDVVVSNTFTQKWEMERYLKEATDRSYEVTIFRCTGSYGNTHNLPVEAMERMSARFENIEGEVLI